KVTRDCRVGQVNGQHGCQQHDATRVMSPGAERPSHYIDAEELRDPTAGEYEGRDQKSLPFHKPSIASSSSRGALNPFDISTRPISECRFRVPIMSAAPGFAPRPACQWSGSRSPGEHTGPAPRTIPAMRLHFSGSPGFDQSAAEAAKARL